MTCQAVRALVGTLGVLWMMTGCSLAMRGVDPQQSPQEEPVCADSYLPVMVDASTSTVISGTLAQLLQDGSVPLDNSVVFGGVAVSLMYTVSAIIGASKYRACRHARADWYARQAIAKLRASAPAGSPIEDGGLGPLRAPAYFCMRSSTRTALNICVRGREACEHARRLFAARDGEVCEPRDVAWCFDLGGEARCFETQDVCEPHRARQPEASSACSERR